MILYMIYLGYVKNKPGEPEIKMNFERDIGQLIKDGQAKHAA